MKKHLSINLLRDWMFYATHISLYSFALLRTPCRSTGK